MVTFSIRASISGMVTNLLYNMYVFCQETMKHGRISSCVYNATKMAAPYDNKNDDIPVGCKKGSDNKHEMISSLVCFSELE